LKSVSHQYANALADVALEQKGAPQVTTQLRDFAAAYAESAELRTALASPAVDRKAKHAIIEKVGAKLGQSKTVRNFLFLVADHQRTHMLAEMIAAFEEVVQKRQGVAEAAISSAVELTAEQKAELAFTLERLTGKRVEPSFSLDASLLGGAVVRIGDTIYDGSLRNRLDVMRERLTAES
jgi:F-type H+-transporting ATPase subunit delta